MNTAAIKEKIIAYSEPREDGCWVWKKYTSIYGYGLLFVDGKARGAHRVAYTAFVGEIPPGLQLDHLCRVRNCVNPWHLEPVTQRENLRRGFGPSAINRRKTHCCRGHEFNSENISMVNKKTTGLFRRCLVCQRLDDAKFREKKRLLSAQTGGNKP